MLKTKIIIEYDDVVSKKDLNALLLFASSFENFSFFEIEDINNITTYSCAREIK